MTVLLATRAALRRVHRIPPGPKTLVSPRQVSHIVAVWSRVKTPLIPRTASPTPGRVTLLAPHVHRADRRRLIALVRPGWLVGADRRALLHPTRSPGRPGGPRAEVLPSCLVRPGDVVKPAIRGICPEFPLSIPGRAASHRIPRPTLPLREAFAPRFRLGRLAS